MTNLGKQISFIQLLEDCERIEIPLIQRDYAQGRNTVENIRKDFINALYDALLKDYNDATLPLNLDFVYGSIDENGGKFFHPLDGQQRLTTLFLLHWYLAWRDEQLPDLQKIFWDQHLHHSRFSYSVRPSSTEFFDELVQYTPDESPNVVKSVRKLIENQSWFYLNWRLDPTIQSALTMLDALHEKFKECTGIFSRLMDKERPAITFRGLFLEHFGLSDDLYIKMNARGKPLTPFETFKARFRERLKEFDPTGKRDIEGVSVPISEFFSSRMDTRWTDFFWDHRQEASTVIDTAVMNLFWVLAWVSLEFADEGTDIQMGRFRSAVGDYSDFLELGLLTKSFADNLICLLESWSSDNEAKSLKAQLPDNHYFDEYDFFTRATTESTKMQYSELVLFAAFVSYLTKNEGNIIASEFQEWMRIIWNLVQNSDIERPDDYKNCLRGLKELLPQSQKILHHLMTRKDKLLGFSQVQLQEESLKASLILTHKDWEKRIHKAERHGYFKGQIGFLLEFAGARVQSTNKPVHEWSPDEHKSFQDQFDVYLKKVKLTFTDNGLSVLPGESHQWQRTLLAVGNYLMHLGLNYSFVVNSSSSPRNWKRFLRGEGREILKMLWDRLDVTVDISPQLAALRKASSLEPWRAAIINCPAVIEYCGQGEIRVERDWEKIYLLKKKQMNGTHAELFTYVLYFELESLNTNLAPFVLKEYKSATMTEIEPHIALSLGNATFCIESKDNMFQITVAVLELKGMLHTKEKLRNELGFEENTTLLYRKIPREKASDFILELASKLAGAVTHDMQPQATAARGES